MTDGTVDGGEMDIYSLGVNWWFTRSASPLPTCVALLYPGSSCGRQIDTSKPSSATIRGNIALFSCAELCTVQQFKQRAPLRFVNDYNNLQVTDLTTNRAVGSSTKSRSGFGRRRRPEWVRERSDRINLSGRQSLRPTSCGHILCDIRA